MGTLPDKDIEERFKTMPIGMRVPVQYVNGHELHRPGAAARATTSTTELLDKAQVNQHSHESIISFGVGYDDAVLRDVPV